MKAHLATLVVSLLSVVLAALHDHWWLVALFGATSIGALVALLRSLPPLFSPPHAEFEPLATWNCGCGNHNDYRVTTCLKCGKQVDTELLVFRPGPRA